MAGSRPTFWGIVTARYWTILSRSRRKRNQNSASSSTSYSPKLYPDLYGKIHHKVRINYYPPRGDNKEGWDNIDIFGWLGYPMQIKGGFPLPRFDPRRTDCARLGPLSRFRQTRRDARHSGMVKLLLQVSHVRAGALPGARPVHSVHEAEKHAAMDNGCRSDHPPGAGILRLIGFGLLQF
jgi:hypothetical protein